MLSQRRARFAGLSRSLGMTCSFLSPNAWTGISILFGIAAAYALSQQMFLTGALAFALAALCDAIDGAVARAQERATKVGAYLDTVVDRYVEFFILIGLFFAALPGFYLPAALWILVYLFGSIMTTYVKAAAKEKDLVSSELRGGLLERAERMALLFIGIVLAAIQPVYLTMILALLALLAHVTALQRISSAIRAAAGKP